MINSRGHRAGALGLLFGFLPSASRLANEKLRLRRTARIMAIAVHPYISGVPHRIKYFERIFDELAKHDDVVFWTGEEILDWYKSARPS